MYRRKVRVSREQVCQVGEGHSRMESIHIDLSVQRCEGFPAKRCELGKVEGSLARMKTVRTGGKEE